MKNLTTLLMVLLPLLSIAQSDNYVNTLEKFRTHFNEGNAKSIYNMFDEVMQASVDLSMTEEIVTTFQSNYGTLTSTTFISKEGSIEKYIATFKRGKLTLSLSLASNNKINGLLFRPYDDNSPSKMDRNETSLILPFKGEWFTFWGGDTKAQNYHVTHRTQKHAFDFIQLGTNGLSYERSGTRNEDYYAFGKPLYAVCDAEVVEVTTTIPDNRPSQMNSKHPLGNYLILKTARHEFIVYAHFEQNTISVQKNDTVKQGQYLGNTGNSGNSSEPHLHFHIQDGPDILNAGGVKAYFETVLVNGVVKEDYSPVKNDRIVQPESK